MDKIIKKKWIFGFALFFFLALSLNVSAAEVFNISAMIMADTGDTGLDGNIPNNGDTLLSKGWDSCTNAKYNNSLVLNGSMAMSAASGNCYEDKNMGAVYNWSIEVWYFQRGTATQSALRLWNAAAGDFLQIGSAGATFAGSGITACTAPKPDDWNLLKIYNYDNTIIYYCMGNTTGECCVPGTLNGIGNVNGRKSLEFDTSYSFDNFMMYYGNVSPFFAYHEAPPAPPATSTTLNISAGIPANNTQFPTSLMNFSLSANASFNFNCSLLINGTINNTREYTSGTEKYVNFSLNLADGAWTYQIQCWDNNSAPNTTTKLFYIDSIYPTSSSSFISNKAYQFGSNFSAWFYCIDETILHSINITLNGNALFGDTSLTATTVNYTINISSNNYTLGINNLTLRCADGHTKNTLLGEYEFKIPYILKNSLRYDFKKPYNKGYVEIVSGSIFDEFSTKKEKDRYTFNLKPNSIKTSYEFDVYSDFNIKIVNAPNTPYKKWLIFDDHWLDFNEESGADVEIQRINSRQVKVIVANVPSKPELKFSSIGDLNIITANYSFYVFNVTESWPSPVVETANSIFSMSVYASSAYVSDVNAYLIFNKTSYTATKTIAPSFCAGTCDKNWSFTQVNNSGLISSNLSIYPFYWTFNVVSNGTGSYNLTNHTQEVYQMIIDNCTSGQAKNNTYNFTYYDELSTSNIVNARAEGNFKVWYSSSSLSRTYSLKYHNDSFSQFCIYPGWAALTSDYEFLFTPTDSATYPVENAYANGITLSTNPGQNRDIYFLTISNATLITINLYDQYNNEVVGYLIQAWKYSLATNNYTLVGTEKTDTNGQVKMYLYVASNEYRFIIKDTNGTTALTTEKMKLFSTEYTFRLPSTTTFDSPLFYVGWLDHTLTFDDLTNITTLYWNDLTPIASHYYLEVYNGTTNGSILLFRNISTSNSGTMTYTLPGDYGFWNVVFYINYTADHQKYYVDSLNIDKRRDWDVFGVETLLFGMIYICVLVGIGITISAEIAMIMAIVGLVGMYLLGFINLSNGIVGLIAIVITGIILIVRAFRR